MKYTKEYFIKKFEAIPDKEIGTGSIDHRCALWHCGMHRLSDKFMTDEANALGELIDKNKSPLWAISDLNDGWRCEKLGSTPKERILNKLKTI